MMIEITFKDLNIDDLVVPISLGYHAARLLPGLRRLNGGNASGSGWKGESIYQLSADLKLVSVYLFPHGLRYALRDLMDCGAIDLEPDPRIEPIL